MAERFEVTTDATVAEFLHDAYRSVSREIEARLAIDPRPLFAPADARMEHNLAVRDRLKELAIAAHEGRLVIVNNGEREEDEREIPDEELAAYREARRRQIPYDEIRPKPHPPTQAGGVKRTPDGGEWVTER